jgi:hypothetical protein
MAVVAGRSTGSLDGMFTLKCPWCDQTAVSLGTRLGSRPSTVQARWYQLTRSVSVCPHCSQPVKYSRREQAWLLLMVPLLGVMAAQAASSSELSVFPRGVVFLSVLLALVGAVLFRATVKLEKVHAI